MNMDMLSRGFDILQRAGGMEQISQLMSEIASVPEPATATLGLLGLAALMMRRRRA